VIGPLATYAEGFRLELAGLGYTPGSGENHVWVMARLSRWLVGEGLELGDLDSVRVEQFRSALRANSQKRVPNKRALAPLLTWLRDQCVVPVATRTSAASALDELLDSYHRWLVDERGLAARTIGRYEATARRFLVERSQAAGRRAGVEGLTGRDVAVFLLGECSRVSVDSAKGRVAELRSLLRFLYLEGLTSTELATAVPPVAGWHDTGLPPTLASSDVRALVTNCDRSLPIGLRDFAIVTLLARLGLRAAEVAGLKLADVDWRAGEIFIRGKSRRYDRLPLPADVGEALVAYLSRGRPQVESRALFLTCRAPLRAMGSTTISRVVHFACLRAGVAPVGAHRLRDALATDLLRQGAALAEISQVLRHRDLATLPPRSTQKLTEPRCAQWLSPGREPSDECPEPDR
jgi:site-specific recombinase XerD